MVWADFQQRCDITGEARSEGCERASHPEGFSHQASYTACRTITSFPHA